jgi:hypothetical protein
MAAIFPANTTRATRRTLGNEPRVFVGVGVDAQPPLQCRDVDITAAVITNTERRVGAADEPTFHDHVVASRAAGFVFYIGDRLFEVITASVFAPQAQVYTFTSSLPLAVLKLLALTLNSTIRREEITS